MFFLEIQQLAEALIFLDGGGAVSRLLLSLGQLRAQTLVFGNELVIVVKISVKALKPVGNGAYHTLHRGFDRARHILYKSCVSLEKIGCRSDDERYDEHYNAELYSVFLKIIFYVQKRCTPISSSIWPSLHSGSPITLK